jgi:hypothetical protein
VFFFSWYPFDLHLSLCLPSSLPLLLAFFFFIVSTPFAPIYICLLPAFRQ